MLSKSVISIGVKVVVLTFAFQKLNSLNHLITFRKSLFFIVAGVYIFMAWSSNGYYHADEHYQLIEFAGLKLGTNSSADLPWEFKEQMRPAFQPVIAYFVLSLLKVLNINDPYHQMFVLRLLSAVLAILVFTFFIQTTKNRFKEDSVQILYPLLFYFLWFIPFLSVRFSSETWSGLFFLWAFSFVYRNDDRHDQPIWLGLLLGISFLCRFQITFAGIGLLAWLIIFGRKNLKYFAKSGVVFLSVLLIGFLIDSWFYGNYVFTPYLYFRSVIESDGSGFGISPWYFYLLKMITYPGFFIGLPLLFSLLFLMVLKPKQPLIWVILPFVIFHSFVPHKEERFLFPIAFLVPFVLMNGYYIFLTYLKSTHWLRYLNVMWIIFFILNLPPLLAMMVKSAGIGRIEITQFIHNEYRDKPIHLIFCTWGNPYNPWQSIPVKFYEESNLSATEIRNICALSDSLIQPNSVNLLVIRKIDQNKKECLQLLDETNFELVKQSVPDWILSLNKIYGGLDEQEILLLYQQKTD